MKVIIMAAGVGTPLSKRFSQLPKCCTDLGGESLIQRTLRLLRGHGLKEVAIVTGYQAAVLRSHVGPEAKVRFHTNPFFDVTNSVSSIWFARNELDGRDDVMIMNGDMFFEPSLLDVILSPSDAVTLYADPRETGEGTYGFKYADGQLLAFGKDLPAAETTGGYIGVAKLHRGIVKEFRSRVDQLVAFHQHTLWWEDALYKLWADGMPIQVREVTQSFWAELDYYEDYERVCEHLAGARSVA